jgi:hypothetical protein
VLDNAGQKIDRFGGHRCSAANVQRGSRRDIRRLDVIPIQASAGLHCLVEGGNQQAASEQSDILAVDPEPIPLGAALLAARHAFPPDASAQNGIKSISTASGDRLCPDEGWSIGGGRARQSRPKNWSLPLVRDGAVSR